MKPHEWDYRAFADWLANQCNFESYTSEELHEFVKDWKNFHPNFMGWQSWELDMTIAHFERNKGDAMLIDDIVDLSPAGMSKLLKEQAEREAMRTEAQRKQVQYAYSRGISPDSMVILLNLEEYFIYETLSEFLAPATANAHKFALEAYLEEHEKFSKIMARVADFIEKNFVPVNTAKE